MIQLEFDFNENNNVELIITEHHFEERINPRFRIWITSTNKQVGDVWRIYEYMAWINRHATNFKDAHGMKVFEPIGRLESFTEYLKQKD